MKFGLFSNDRRPTRTIGEAWDLDIDEIVHADSIGMHEAWISEHEASAEHILCRAAGVTSSIRLGPAVRILPIYHPLQVAIDAAASDQLTHGRYMLGVGRGFSPIKQENRGTEWERAHDMTSASLEVILRLFESREPFDFENEFWKGSRVSLPLDFVQQPHPPLAISVAVSPSTAVMAGKLGIGLLTADFTSPARLREFGDALEQGQAAAGRPTSRREIRASRVVYVSHSDEQAREEMRPSYEALIAWEIENTPWHQTDRIPPGGTLADITYDYLVDTGNLFIGAPETVRQMVERYYEESGGFGVLMFHAARDYVTHQKVKQSMSLFMSEVAPKIEHLASEEAAQLVS